MIDTDRPQKTLESLHGDASSVIIMTIARPAEAEAARWAKNIFTWSSYLPHDCVKLMIQMGWHHST